VPSWLNALFPRVFFVFFSSLSDSDDERALLLFLISGVLDASCGCAEAQPLSLLRNTRPLRRLGSQILMMKIRMHAFLLAIKPALDVVCLYLQICRHLAECATYSTKWTATGNLFVRELSVVLYFRRVDLRLRLHWLGA
jgi:hypothetical protein